MHQALSARGSEAVESTREQANRRSVCSGLNALGLGSKVLKPSSLYAPRSCQEHWGRMRQVGTGTMRVDGTSGQWQKKLLNLNGNVMETVWKANYCSLGSSSMPPSGKNDILVELRGPVYTSLRIPSPTNSSSPELPMTSSNFCKNGRRLSKNIAAGIGH
ncbi:hypothetical protein BC827DRAFT_1386619 [Russula dissimulans]|nr:hypothetical protein BC827DRAFT_1386619 [Russula dissimulans]